ncbi:tryptophan synthase subunit alpha [Methanosarcina sp. 2.H.A.1B.4]|uniref:tryptophan synthase subunit alpha n=1 Tax=Methanosarcina sp. 2.H.A.1B.4 TaxID=1483600 RepID=UPI0006213FC4|nr:tryptophan synthase subunit alpha [Methanosarcina sp. 2.H.A.1B.4]KKG07929.1 tryptophan synthase subunit alpha [Methanosarcina sp. 2.H.A.1B.4]
METELRRQSRRQKISEKFSELREKKEGALIGYVMAGDPSAEATTGVVKALAKGGADIIELGFPFSDPVADGPTIQAAGQRALAAGMDIEGYFELVRALEVEVPLVCMTYYNPVFRYGVEKFVAHAAEAGISGLIIPDIPVEEAADLKNSCEKHGLDLIFLVAPTTTDARILKILQRGSGFIYLVSRLGVTGTRADVSGSTKELLSRVKTDIPKAVGFGISTGKQAAEVRKAGADAVIVGSAFVRIIEEGKDVNEKLEALVRELKSGLLEAN